MSRATDEVAFVIREALYKNGCVDDTSAPVTPDLDNTSALHVKSANNVHFVIMVMETGAD